MTDAEQSKLTAQAAPVGEQAPLVLDGYNWEQYLSIDELFSESGVSVRFLQGALEIMAPVSVTHERRKANLGRLVEAWCLAREVRFASSGNATMKIFQEAGGEPDESYHFNQEEEIPDLVIEVALTSGGLSKRAFYRRFKVPELWIWRNEDLLVFRFDDVSGEYVESTESGVLEGIDLGALAECVIMDYTSDAIREFSKRCDF